MRLLTARAVAWSGQMVMLRPEESLVCTQKKFKAPMPFSSSVNSEFLSPKFDGNLSNDQSADVAYISFSPFVASLNHTDKFIRVNKRTSPTDEAGQVEGIRACWLCLDFFQQTHDLELARPHLLQCDRLFQPCSSKKMTTAPSWNNIGIWQNFLDYGKSFSTWIYLQLLRMAPSPIRGKRLNEDRRD